ncbi:anthranilate synthase component I [Tepiditoga spiralis]|uniref:Anthranilate synthase component I n=1 Tax=Tepiditoga spiralis TaxID=2108365 RepID=A0A7G1G7Y5_9BACT|nr:chorismate-binding protein [Tepiditoga spiralis]BBE31013.1 anthranilate synthase component I [Tepiditoga spiralis]
MVSIEKINFETINTDLILQNLKFIGVFEKDNYSIFVLEKAFELIKKKEKYFLKKEGKRKFIKTNKNYLEVLNEFRKFIPENEFKNYKNIPFGGIGYLGYEYFNEVEDIKFNKKYHDNLYDCNFIFGRTFLILDYLKKEILILSMKYLNETKSIDTKSNVKKVKKEVENILNKKNYSKKGNLTPYFYKIIQNESKNEFLSKINYIKKEIENGNLIQCVLSRNIKIKTNIPFLNLYKRLRKNNPSPYMFYFNFDDITLFGTSPESMVSVKDEIILVNPIAGTRKRGCTKFEDNLLIEDLLNDKKEQAEHLMLVDLARNDLGKVSQKNTVNVKEYMNIEKFESVIHIVSKVNGLLEKNKTSYDVIKATFPAGTVTGAPKLQSIKTIELLEKDRRGPYAGLIGFFDFYGNFDSCITIRSAVCKEDTIRLQAGAGIVYDSIPEKEYLETENKIKSLLKVIKEEVKKQDDTFIG